MRVKRKFGVKFEVESNVGRRASNEGDCSSPPAMAHLTLRKSELETRHSPLLPGAVDIVGSGGLLRLLVQTGRCVLRTLTRTV